MKNFGFILLLFGVIFLIAPACSAQADKTSDKPCCDEHATYTEAKADTTVRTHKASCRCGKLTVTYEGPVPQRRTLCHCNSCQSRTGTAFSIQGRFPRDKSVIKGESSTWKFPDDAGKVDFRSCDSGGATYHFCPTCGTTVYWDIDVAPEIVGIALGTLTDPSFPAPVISAFEAYGHPWAMTAGQLEAIRLEYDELKEKLEELKKQQQNK